MASRDFLGGFGRDGGQAPAGGGADAGAGGESDEIELSLGLSLGGCFGSDPSQDGKRLRLQRSSSIASICSLPAATSCGGAQDAAAAPAAAAPTDQQLLRTSSLPAEYMEDRLRRRAMQSQRRLEAKRKRLERRNSMNSGRPVPAAGGGAAGRDEGLEHTVPTGFQLRRTVAALTTAGSPTPSRQQQGLAERRAEASSPAATPPSADGVSIGQSSSSPVPKETTTAGGRPSSDGAAAGHEQQQPPPPTPPLRTLRSLTMRTASTGDLRNTMAEDMPMVSYKAAEGPSGVGGRKTDGFLYKYRKGEEVRIVCVCHGSFLTPAEFVKHAGGGEVANPLRHIVVNPQQSVFL